MQSLKIVAAAVVALIPLSLALAQHHHEQKAGPAPVAPAKAVQLVELTVTEDGFVPAEVKVKAGQPVRLRVTRKVDATCAKDIVIKAAGVNKPLPLGVPVEVEFTPAKGKTRFACAMDMVAGAVIAE